MTVIYPLNIRSPIQITYFSNNLCIFQQIAKKFAELIGVLLIVVHAKNKITCYKTALKNRLFRFMRVEEDE